MAVTAPMRWLGILLLALASLGCGILDKLTNSDGDKLTIQSFSASPVTIEPGSSTTLAWEVDGAEVVSIDNGIGAVPPKGSRQVLPGATTTYSMTAQSSSAAISASAQVVVQGSPAGTPTPSTTPTPVATATPTATPPSSPTATPTPVDHGPTPTPSSTAVPTATPTAPACGAPAGNAGTCTVSITKPNPVSGGGCVEVTLVATDHGCPVGQSIPLLLRFEVTAHTSAATLSWRAAASNDDVLDPAQGSLIGNGASTVVLTDVVLGSAAQIEILEGPTVVLSLAVHH